MSILNDIELKQLENSIINIANDLDIKENELKQILGTESDLIENEGKVLQKASYLLRIHESLGTTYPMNKEYRKLWLHKKCTKLRGRVPIIVMMTEGTTGLIEILSHLDCTFSWGITGSTAKY